MIAFCKAMLEVDTTTDRLSHQGERTDGRNKKKWNEQGSILESD